MSIELATINNLESVLEIFKERVDWFWKNKIIQWDKNYCKIYDYNYLLNMMKEEKLFVVKENDMVIGTFLLKKKDKKYWNDEKNAYYIHHFCTKLGYPGLGEKMLDYIENMAKKESINYLRLDCVSDSFISKYWSNHGFVIIKKKQFPYPCTLYEKKV